MIGWLIGPEFEKYIPLLYCTVISVFCTIVLGFVIDSTINNQNNINNIIAIQAIINNNVTNNSPSSAEVDNEDKLYISPSISPINNDIGICLSYDKWNDIVTDLHEIVETMEDSKMIHIACLVLLAIQILLLVGACFLLRKGRGLRESGTYITKNKERSPLLSATLSGHIPTLARTTSASSISTTKDGAPTPVPGRKGTSMMHEGPLYEPWNQATLDKLSSEADLTPAAKVTRGVYRYGPIAGRIMARRFGHLLTDQEQVEVNRILCL